MKIINMILLCLVILKLESSRIETEQLDTALNQIAAIRVNGLDELK